MLRQSVVITCSAVIAFAGLLGRTAAPAEVDDLSPLRSLRWEVPAPNELKHQNIVDEQRRQLIADGIAPVPTATPLAVKVPVLGKPDEKRNLILVRSAHRLLLIDADTGQRVAFFPPQRASPFIESPSISGLQRSTKTQDTRPWKELDQRTWRDELLGSLISDSGSVFFVDDSPDPLNGRHGPLLSIDLVREGAMQWSVGGEDGGDEPKLAGATFLGAPLVRKSSLFALVRQDDHVRLIQLNKKKGTLQQRMDCLDLADQKLPRAYWDLSYSPVQAGNVLLCPLPSGGMLAVEPMSEAPKWTYTPAAADRVRRVDERLFQVIRPSSAPGDPVLSQPLIAGEAIIVPHPIDRRLVCLNIEDGKLHWKAERAVVYLAGIDGDKVIVVSRDAIAALSLDDGTQSWESPLGPKKLPSGSGLLHKRHYYSPTIDGHLSKIDLRTGKIVKSVEMDAPLGNLTCDRDYLVSYNGARVQSFFIAEALASRVAARLGENPDDPWALARKGELLLAEGDAEAALRWLRRSLVQGEADATERSIVEVTLQLLRDDAKRYVEAGDGALAITQRPSERIELLQRMAMGYADGGQPKLALAYCLRLVDELDNRQDSSQPIFVEPEVGRRVRVDRWLQGWIARLQRQIADDPDNLDRGD